MFGEDCVDFKDDKNVSVTVDGKTAYICLETRVSRRSWRTCTPLSILHQDLIFHEPKHAVRLQTCL